MSEQYPVSNASLEAVIGMLILRLNQAPEKLYYVDIYPIDPKDKEAGHTYELSEAPLENSL